MKKITIVVDNIPLIQHNFYTKYNIRSKKIYMCLRFPDQPYFSAADPNLFFISNYSTLIFASDPINFNTEFR